MRTYKTPKSRLARTPVGMGRSLVGHSLIIRSCALLSSIDISGWDGGVVSCLQRTTLDAELVTSRWNACYEHSADLV